MAHLLVGIHDEIYYNHVDEDIELANSYEAKHLNLAFNHVAKSVEIKSCYSLETAKLPSSRNFTCLFYECFRLSEITHNSQYKCEILEVTGNNSFLEKLDLENVGKLLMNSSNLTNLKQVRFGRIEEMLMDFTVFKRLEYLFLESVNIDTLRTVSNRLVKIFIDNCKIKNIHIDGENDNLLYLKISNTDYDVLDIQHNIPNIKGFYLKRPGMTIRNIPFVNNKNQISAYIFINTEYDDKIKNFIENSNVKVHKDIRNDNIFSNSNALFSEKLDDMEGWSFTFNPPDLSKMKPWTC